MHTHIELSAEMITDDRVRKAFAYWEDVRHGRLMPSRSDIEPLDLRFCLGWICMVDVCYEPQLRFRFRLDGSKLVELTGFDLTGKYVDEIDSAEYRQLSQTVYGRVVDTKAPLFFGNRENWLKRGFYMESITLPLSDNGVDVSGLMEVICPTKAQNRRPV